MILLILGIVWLTYELFFSKCNFCFLIPTFFICFVIITEFKYSVLLVECETKGGVLIYSSCIDKKVVLTK